MRSDVAPDDGAPTLETAAELRSLDPRVRVELIEDAGHGVPYDQPERLGAVIASIAREQP